MRITNIETTLWLFALNSKCKTFASSNLFYLISLLSLAWVLLCLLRWPHKGGPAWGKQKCVKLSSVSIPGPRGFPLIGSMSLMTGLAHRKLSAAAEAYKAKRLMAFSMGETRVIITCNPDVAKEILNSSVFVDRPVKESAYSLMFNRAIGFAPYGAFWRTLRKIAAVHLFSPKQIKASEGQRVEIVRQLIHIIGTQREKVCIREVLKQASLNNMMSSIFGKKYNLAELSQEAKELRELIDEGYDLLGKSNWSDHLPWLTSFDLQGIRSRCSELVPKVNRFVNRVIEEHKNKVSGAEVVEKDFTDVLLSLQGSEKLSDSDMVAVLWEMIFRGTDTVAVLIEWILTRLVLHPDVQSMVQNELDMVVGKSNVVAEFDVAKLVYLNAVVKEVLRLHPPGPLLSWARLAITDTRVDGYDVPAGTTAMVNMWAIARDPDLWSYPLSFKPERFVDGNEGSEFSLMGSDLRLAPFGSGRRTCPGKTLGLSTVTFWVASLLHKFKWTPCDVNNLDLNEVLKLSCEKANPLVVNVFPRRISG